MKIKQLITIFGIIILVLSMGLGAYFAYTNGLFTIKSDPSIKPTNIKITNINHDRFSVSWVTDAKTIGSVIYGKSGKLDQLQIDDNDQLSGQQVARVVHHVTFTSLDPETVYQFKIRSGERNTIFDDNGKPFSTSTAPVLSTQLPADLINGTVTINNKPATDAIVYVTLPGATQLSTQVKKDGSWLINLAITRNTSLTDYAKYDPQKTDYNIFVQGDTNTSKVTLTTANDSPVPDIVLGESYDFTSELALASPTPLASPENIESTESASLASQFPLETEKETTNSAQIPEQNLVGSNDVEILNPYEEYEEINTDTPEFQGTGPAGTVLSLMISGTDVVNTSTTVNSAGQWSYTPVRALTSGNYTIKLSYVDTYGETQNLERNFIIAASGTGGTTPAYTATTSAQTATPSPIATLAPRKSMPSTASGTPTSGFELPTFILLLLGFGLVFTGAGWKKSLRLF